MNKYEPKLIEVIVKPVINILVEDRIDRANVRIALVPIDERVFLDARQIKIIQGKGFIVEEQK